LGALPTLEVALMKKKNGQHGLLSGNIPLDSCHDLSLEPANIESE
jgi:hypothetical protein